MTLTQLTYFQTVARCQHFRLAASELNISQPSLSRSIANLEEELENPEHSREELDMIQYKYDLKMTVYVFTCILAGERSLAKNVYMRWQGRRRMRTRLLRAELRTAMIMPAGVNRFLYKIRLKVF